MEIRNFTLWQLRKSPFTHWQAGKGYRKYFVFLSVDQLTAHFPKEVTSFPISGVPKWPHVHGGVWPLVKLASPLPSGTTGVELLGRGPLLVAN